MTTKEKPMAAQYSITISDSDTLTQMTFYMFGKNEVDISYKVGLLMRLIDSRDDDFVVTIKKCAGY